MTEYLKLGETQTLRITKSTADVLELESTWSSGSDKKPPSHYHPSQDEYFQVLEGELTVELGGEPARVLRSGESVTIPRGTAHRMWNASDETARATWRVTPAMRTEELFRFMDRGLSALRIPAMLWKFRREYRLAPRR